MIKEHNHLREFGKFRLDLEKKFLWHTDTPVQLPLKAVDLLCLLVDRSGDLVTKDEIWRSVWHDSFVEETNLTHNIYLLRKTLKDLGETELIQTVPRRGYRFTGKVHDVDDHPVIVERHSFSRTLIEDVTGQQTAVDKKTATGIFLSPRHVLAMAVILSVALIGGFSFRRYENNLVAGSVSNIRSLAVLPFKTINAARENEHQGLGLADVLITRLSNLKSLTVRPTSAVSAFENQETDFAQVAQKLNVDAVLEGTIYRADNQLRVTMRLLKSSDNKTIWSGQFEKPLRDELKVEDEIVLQVVDALALNLSGDEQKNLTKTYTESADAYQLYQKGRFEWNKRSVAGMIEAERLFRNAIDKDPNFALAYVGLADRLATDLTASNEAFQVIEKAIEIDPNLAEAHATLGFLQMFHKWNWPEAEVEFKKSIALNNGYSTAHHWYATLLEIEGKNAEAKVEFTRALEINPLSYNFLGDLGQFFYFNHEYGEAQKYCQESLEIYPDFVFAHDYLSDIYLQTGEPNAAVEEKLKSDKINNSFANQSADQQERIETILATQRGKYKSGDIREFLARRLDDSTTDADTNYDNAKIYAFLGDQKKALDNLEKAFQGRSFVMAFVKAEPIFDNLRDESRFREILQKLNLAN